MKRILITGSRNWSDVEAIRAALVAHGPGVVVHGNARGADSIAELVADDLGWRFEAHPAQWGKHGRKAGPLRNQAMVDAGADVCLAFPMPDSRGTWDCIRKAEAAGIPVVVCRAQLPVTPNG